MLRLFICGVVGLVLVLGDIGSTPAFAGHKGWHHRHRTGLFHQRHHGCYWHHGRRQCRWW